MSASSPNHNYYRLSLSQPQEDDEGREEQVLEAMWGRYYPEGSTPNSYFEDLVKRLEGHVATQYT